MEVGRNVDVHFGRAWRWGGAGVGGLGSDTIMKTARKGLSDIPANHSLAKFPI